MGLLGPVVVQVHQVTALVVGQEVDLILYQKIGRRLLNHLNLLLVVNLIENQVFIIKLLSKNYIKIIIYELVLKFFDLNNLILFSERNPSPESFEKKSISRSMNPPVPTNRWSVSPTNTPSSLIPIQRYSKHIYLVYNFIYL